MKFQLALNLERNDDTISMEAVRDQFRPRETSALHTRFALGGRTKPLREADRHGVHGARLPGAR